MGRGWKNFEKQDRKGLDALNSNVDTEGTAGEIS